jgi:hemolysin activation/secretion protein
MDWNWLPARRSSAWLALNGAVCFSYIIACVLLTSSPAQAQSNAGQTNPGAIQQGIGRQQNQFEQQNPAPLGPGVVAPGREKPPAVKPGGPKFLLRKVTFDKSKFLTPQELNNIASKYVGRRVDIATLLQMVAEVNVLYQQKGIVTGIATLPPQNATSGVIHIKLTEGRLEKQTLRGNDQTSSNYILHRVGEPTGEVLDVPKLNRDVTWFNRTNDTQIKALLQPGSSFGLTDLDFAVTEAPRNTLELFCDNQGIQTTGEDECGTFYKLHSLLGVDDRLTFYGVKSSGNINGSLAYNIPVNVWGGRLGASYTQGDIKIVEGPFAPLDETGNSKIGAINFAQPFVASEKWLVLGNLSVAEGSTLSDLAATPTTSDYYTKATAGVQVSYLTPAFSATISPAGNAIHEHDNILNVNRDFETITGSWNAQIKLPKSLYISDLGSMQYTSAQLLPGDQLFVIGGPTTVRGYPTNVVEGDSGYYNNLELHRDWSNLIRGLDTYMFLDYGEVFSTSPASVDLMSFGGGVSWTPIPAVTLQSSYGRPTRVVEVNQPRYDAYIRVIVRPLLLMQNPP